MAVTHRLRELRAEGKHELADTLAVEALRNETPTVTVGDDHVRVETGTFVGEHALGPSFDPTDEAAVRDALAERGTYALADAEDGRTFTTGCLSDAVAERLIDDATDGAEPTDDGPTIEAGAGTDPDTEPRDDAPAVPVEPTRSPASVIRDAVAAVQSQFRG